MDIQLVDARSEVLEARKQRALMEVEFISAQQQLEKSKKEQAACENVRNIPCWLSALGALRCGLHRLTAG